MLDNLRGMAVFASVVDCGSFSGAAKALGITTSAVSQQVRALENDIGIVLLHRSTRKISLTEAGESFYHSCQDVVTAARNGRHRLSALRDELTGQIRIATTPELAENYLLPAISDWLTEHPELSLHIETENKRIDLIEGRIDIALRVSQVADEARFHAYPLCTVQPILVAAPKFLESIDKIENPDQLTHLEMVNISSLAVSSSFYITHSKTDEVRQVQMKTRTETNSVHIAKTLTMQGKGVLRVLDIDVQDELFSGDLVRVLPAWEHTHMQLYALVLRTEQHPAKVVRCIDLLQKYFEALTSNAFKK